MGIRIDQIDTGVKMFNKVTILMYHYVRDLKNTAFPNIKGLDVHDFHQQILSLKKN